MARPPKNAIHEASYQIKDFFNDESMKRLYPKNPYNVLWFMEELLSKEELENPKWNNFKNHVLECLKNNTIVDYKINPLKEKMIEDELVLKRIKKIIEMSSIDINTLNLATKGVRIKSAPLIEGLLKMGLDPNIPDEINLPLEVALNRKNMKIATLYWNSPKINRFALNKLGESYAEIAIKYKQWKFFEIILKEEPQIIFGTNEKNELNIEKIITLFDGKKYELSKQDIELKLMAEAKNRNYAVNLVPERIRKILIELIDFCDKKNGHINISNPIIKGLWIKKMYHSFNEKFKEKTEMVKVKKLKI